MTLPHRWPAVLGRLLSCCILICALSIHAHGETHQLPDSIERQILSESTPFSFAPLDLSARDFAVEWVGQALPGVEAALEPDSLQWVRVEHIFVLPRARLKLHLPAGSTGQVNYQTFSHPLDASKDTEISVVLTASTGNRLRVVVVREGRRTESTLKIRFKPREPKKRYVGFDSSCSAHGLDTDAVNMKGESWAFVACRMTYVSGQDHRDTVLELYVFWDTGTDDAEVQGVRTAKGPAGLLSLRLGASPGVVRLASGQESFDLKYRIPSAAHFLSVGVGAGPYHYDFSGGSKHASTIAPVLTTYVSYFINETTKLAFFEATPIHSVYTFDFGLYFVFEQFRTVDERFAVNLLLGAQSVAFPYDDSFYLKPRLPQGAELTFRDFLWRKQNLSLGGFFYPKINNTSYYNVWLRFGRGRLFGEVNYIRWEDTASGRPVSWRALGVSVGFPLFQIL